MRRLSILFCAFLVVACSAGSGEGLDANGRPIGEAPDPGNEPTLANIQARVFTPICTQCHVGAAAPQGLRLDSANAFNNLVGVPSIEVSGLLRVDPFNPDDSYLVQKIEGTAAVGGQMPLGGPPLPDADIMLIRQWVLEGAMNTPTAIEGQAKVGSVDFRPTSIRIAFTRSLDASTVHYGTVVLAGIDNTPVENYSVSVSPMNPRAIVIQFPASGLDDVVYRLSINTDENVSMLDLSGQAVEPYRMEFR